MLSRHLLSKSLVVLRVHRTGGAFVSTRRLFVSQQPQTRAQKQQQQKQEEEERQGAFAVLAALEKAKEAQGVKLAQLINGLETILPRETIAKYAPQPLPQAPQVPQSLSSLSSSTTTGEQHVISQPHTNDPAFFWLDPSIITNHPQLTADHVRALLQATRQGRRIALPTVQALIQAATVHFRRRNYHHGTAAAADVVVQIPPLQPPQQTCTVIGDLHGSLADLEAVLGLTGQPTAQNLLVFNGDLADRGDHGLEVICIVLALTLAHPHAVWINRGNHEDLALNFAYGLSQEVKHKYGPGSFRHLLGPALDDLFRVLPVATVIQNDAAIVHAGPPPPGIRIADMAHIINPNRRGLSRTIQTFSEIDDNHRQAHELLEALVWSDPIVNAQGACLEEDVHNRNHGGTWVPNVARGAGHQYDATVVRNFLQSEGLQRLVRSHEPVQRGCERYEIEATVTDSGKPTTTTTTTTKTTTSQTLEFFTVFSASRYPHKEGFNQAAILVLQPNGKHRILRYATEDDEPRAVTSSSTFTEIDNGNHDDANDSVYAIDAASIRRTLQKTAQSYKSELARSLEALDDHYVTGIPLDEMINAVIEALQFDPKGLQTPAARLALAKAILGVSFHGDNKNNDDYQELLETVDGMACLDALLEGDNELDDDNVDTFDDMASSDPTLRDTASAPYYPWLRAIFETLDVQHDGILSRAQWMRAVDEMNANLPAGAVPIQADDFWHLLDCNSDGHVSAAEWDRLAKALSR